MLFGNNYNQLRILDKRTSWKNVALFLLPSLLAIALFTLIPFVITINDSLILYGDAFVIDNAPRGFGNYEQLFRADSDYVIAIRNSLLYAIFSVPLSLFISLLIASAITFISRKFIRNAWISIFFAPYVTSAVAIGSAFGYLFANNGFINDLFGINVSWLSDTSNKGNWNAFVAILVNGVWSNLAFNILIITTAMLGIDKNLYKSASIDGAGKIRQFFKITLPSISKTINFLFTIGIIGAVKIFPLALFNNEAQNAINTSGSTLLLWTYYFTQIGNFGIAASSAIILFLIGIAASSTMFLIFKAIANISLYIGGRNVSFKIASANLLL